MYTVTNVSPILTVYFVLYKCLAKKDNHIVYIEKGYRLVLYL